MATKTVYVKQGDERVWELALKLANRSVSEVVMSALSDYVSKCEKEISTHVKGCLCVKCELLLGKGVE